MTQVIADTSGLYAMVDRKDPHHRQAAQFVKAHAAAGVLVVSNHIFDETMTLVKVRLGIEIALRLGIRLRNSRFVELVTFTTAEEMETWRIFSQYTDKAWSYTDCSCLVLAQERNLQYAFTFDHHFKQMGLMAIS